jgi:hypothetical protein
MFNMKRLAVLTVILVAAMIMTQFRLALAGGGSFDTLSFVNADAQNCGYWEARGSLTAGGVVNYTITDGYNNVLASGSAAGIQGFLSGGFSQLPAQNPIHFFATYDHLVVGDLYANNPCVGYGQPQLTPYPTLQPTAVVPQATPIKNYGCQGTVQTRLAEGMIARVTPGDPNLMFDKPKMRAHGSNRIGWIPAGSTVTVTNGPKCSDGFIWWAVNYNGLSGWTIEGNAFEYWLEPAW